MTTKQSKGLSRNTIDKYYTKPTVVEFCLQHVKTHLQINPTTDLIIEPSAGNGSFIPAIQSITHHYKFYDLEPENTEIIKQDYLLYDYHTDKNAYPKIHIIGNPPFGRQSSMAIKFIKKSCEFCHSISFILPKSFKKDSLKSKFPTQFHMIYEVDLPDKSFLVDGVEHDVPCIFQIWKKEETCRPTLKKLDPDHFTFVKKTEAPHISVRRVGVNAGQIDKNITDKSVQSHYFIQFNNGKSIDENITQLTEHVSYEFNNTVGPKSISKQELIEKYNSALQY